MNVSIDFLKDIMLPVTLSFILSIWIIPYFTVKQMRKKRQLVIALSLGDIIKTIDILIDDLDFASLDKGKYSSVFINSKYTSFVHLAISFDNSLLKAKNQYLYLLHNQNNGRGVDGLIELYSTEYTRLLALQRKLQDVVNWYVEFLSDDIIKQMSLIINGIDGIPADIRSLKTFKETLEEVAPDMIDKNIPSNHLDNVYSNIFELQHLLMNEKRYFTLTFRVDQ